MKKKMYVAPGVKVRNIEGGEMLAGSGTIETGISDLPATGGGRAKSNTISGNEGDAQSSNFNAWED